MLKRRWLFFSLLSLRFQLVVLVFERRLRNGWSSFLVFILYFSHSCSSCSSRSCSALWLIRNWCVDHLWSVHGMFNVGEIYSRKSLFDFNSMFQKRTSFKRQKCFSNVCQLCHELRGRPNMHGCRGEARTLIGCVVGWGKYSYIQVWQTNFSLN